MGGGAKKAHESFVVAPSPSPSSSPVPTAHQLLPTAGTAAGAGGGSPGPAGQGPGGANHGPGEDGNGLGDAGPGEVADPSLEQAQADDDGVPVAQRPPPASGGPLTPVPADPLPGEICGTPLLVGGADLDDSLATLVSYAGPGGPREVLVATVAPEAEPKLFEALALEEEKLVPVAVEKTVEGRLPVDQAQQLFEQLETVAKSANHHLSAGDGIPAHTQANLAKVQAVMDSLGPELSGGAEAAMLAHYQGAAATIAERLAPGYAVPYTAGGKVPKVEPFHSTGTVTVTEYVPAPAGEVPAGLLGAKVRDATRISSTVGADGTTSWNGKARTKVKGKEYAIDLGDGFSAVYRPYAATGTSAEFSQRGSLEVVGPPGAGHGPELVRRLGQLNLVNRAMTPAEGEWAYLRRNIEAQGLGAHHAVLSAMAEAEGLEDATTEVLIAERAHEALGMDQPTLVAFAKGLRLEAEAKALPEKVRIVRDGVAKAKGVGSGEELAAAPGYDPTPRASGGWLVWDRFDVAADPKAARAPFAKRGLYHRVTNNNLVEMLTNGGVLASTERRRLMGVAAGKGMSESADMGSGGAQSVFLRVANAPASGPALFWEDPTALLRRSDWYAYDGDHFGSLNPASGHSTSGLTRDPSKIAGFGGGNNEVMFHHGIDLLGAEAPSLIRCASPAQRTSVLSLLASRGITTLGGRPVTEVVK